jgi:hypothetical protein
MPNSSISEVILGAVFPILPSLDVETTTSKFSKKFEGG